MKTMLLLAVTMGVIFTSARLAQGQASPVAEKIRQFQQEKDAAPAPASHKIGRVDFQQTALESAIQYFRDIAPVNIFVNWKVLNTIGVFRDTPIDLQLSGVSIGHALELTLEDAGGEVPLAYIIDRGVIHIATRKYLARKIYVKVYDIADLLVRIPSFANAPNFSLSQATQSGSGGSGGDIFKDAEEEDEKEAMSKRERTERLEDVVRETIEPNSWDAAGGRGRIRFFGDNMIVSANYFIHQQLGAGHVIGRHQIR